MDIVGNWASILGFFVSVWALINTGKIHSKVSRYAAFKRLEKYRQSLLNELESCRRIVWEDHCLDLRIRGDIISLSTTLSTLGDCFSKQENQMLANLRELLKTSNLTDDDVSRVNVILSHFHGKLSAKEEYLGDR